MEILVKMIQFEKLNLSQFIDPTLLKAWDSRDGGDGGDGVDGVCAGDARLFSEGVAAFAPGWRGLEGAELIQPSNLILCWRAIYRGCNYSIYIYIYIYNDWL